MATDHGASGSLRSGPWPFRVAAHAFDFFDLVKDRRELGCMPRLQVRSIGVFRRAASTHNGAMPGIGTAPSPLTSREN